MKSIALHPWMLGADWRESSCAFVVVNLADWPADIALQPLPPVPVIAMGPFQHPQARNADVVIEDGFTVEALSKRIAATPQAASTLVQLLRATDGLSSSRALTIESFAFAMLQAGTEHAAWLADRKAQAPRPSGALHLSRSRGRLDLLIDRPDARNAIDRLMRDELFDAFALAAIDGTISHVSLRSVGSMFCNGADLSEFGTTRDPVVAHAIRTRTLPAYPLIRRSEIYTVHIQGGCVGAGLELAAFAGRVTASPGAWFHLPEIDMGILPGFGGCVSIPKRIGRQRAALLMLSGKRIGARLAHHWGLIDAIVGDTSVDEGHVDVIG